MDRDGVVCLVCVCVCFVCRVNSSSDKGERMREGFFRKTTQQNEVRERERKENSEE